MYENLAVMALLVFLYSIFAGRLEQTPIYRDPSCSSSPDSFWDPWP